MLTFTPPTFTRDEWQELEEFMRVASSSIRDARRYPIAETMKRRLAKSAKRCDELRGRIQTGQQ